MTTEFQKTFTREVINTTLAPGDLLLPSHDNIDDKYALSTEDSYTLQVYVEESSKIAGTVVEPIEGPKGKITFDDLNDRYKKIGEHAAHWNKNVYPKTVQTAGSVKTYCDFVETYYKGLIEKAKNGDQKGVASTLNYLAKKADEQLKLVTEVQKILIEFRALLIEDNDSISLIYKELDAEFNENSDYRKEIQKEIDDCLKNKDAANKRYNQACINAATSPTYAWVLPPLGLIAAGVVSGIFGKQAVEAKKEAEMWADEAAKNIKLLGLADNVVNTVSVLLVNISGLKTMLDNTLGVIGKICGIWEAIKSDTTALSKGLSESEQYVKEDMDYLAAIFEMDLDALRIIWQRLGKACLSYELTAYIKVNNQ